MDSGQLKYCIAISLIPGIGTVIAKNLIAYIGSPEAVFKEKKAKLLKIPKIGVQLASSIINSDVLGKAEKEIERCNKDGIQIFSLFEKGYPEKLKMCDDAPLVFYYKGTEPLERKKCLSIVGTRNSTERGRDLCRMLCEGLKKHDPLIISGLAYGIDINAHKAALENSLKTIAVLGSNLYNIYPAEHKSIASSISKQGGLLSEFSSYTKVERGSFVSRNRIIAGLSDAVIVVESGVRGGALITAEFAQSYNRDVFTFPGRVDDKYSKGCNNLIKRNKATLIESVEDIEYMLNWESQNEGKAIQQSLFDFLENEEQIIADILKNDDNIGIDQIALKSKIQMSKVSSLLLQMEFKGVVKSLPGKQYRLLAN